MDAPIALYSAQTAFAGYAIDDLLRLMPGRRVSQTFWVQFHPVFSEAGAVELWAEYDCSEMAQGDPRVFAGRLRSETIVVPIRSEPVVVK